MCKGDFERLNFPVTTPPPCSPCPLTHSLPVDFALLHPSGCLRQSFSRWSIVSPFGPTFGCSSSKAPAFPVVVHKIPYFFSGSIHSISPTSFSISRRTLAWANSRV